MALTLNEKERKLTLELCEDIVLGFQNEHMVGDPIYTVLQEVYERIHKEVQPILVKESIEANENIGVETLARYLNIKSYYAKLMLDGAYDLISSIAKYSKEEAQNVLDVKACFIGDLHQQILIMRDGAEELISIYWNGGGENENRG